MRFLTNRGPAALLLPLALAATGLLTGEARAQGTPPDCVPTPAPIVASGPVSLVAGPCTLTLPGATGPEAVTMWGFGTSATAISIPGPAIVVPPPTLPATASLTINLTNNLPEDVSIVMPGQLKSMTPIFFPPDAKGRRRVQSFDAVAPAGGGTQTYAWTNMKPGSLLYQSGSHPGVQVQMGLYGAVAVSTPTAGEVYAGVPFDKEVFVVLSEVDTTLHAAVAAGTYGPAGTVTSPIDYHPKYYLVNGAPYAPGAAISTASDGVTPLNPNDSILIRFLNAGLKTHAMALFAPTQGTGVPAPYVTLRGEDGNPYPYPRQQYDVFLPAGKTVDAIFSTPGSGDFNVVDRALWLTNGAVGGDAGMQTAIRIAAVSGAPFASPDTYTLPANAPLNQAAPGVLANDTGSGTLQAQLVSTTGHGGLTLNADGSFSYTPTAGFCGPDSFTYRVTNGTATSNTVTVQLRVTLPPTANADTYTVNAGATLTVAASGVLANDTDCLAAPLTATLDSGPTAGSFTVPLAANGSFTYLAPTAAGSATFTYHASNGSANSASATVTINVPRPPPVAANDVANTFINVPVAINVLANDTVYGAPAFTPNLASVTVSATSRGGSAVANPATGVVTYTPPANAGVTDTFTYTFRDSANLLSNTGLVTVNVAGSQVSKSFSPTSVAQASARTSTLRITISNAGAAALTGVTFTDNLPSGLTISGTPTVSQCGGTVSSLASGAQLRLTGGTIAAASSTTYGSCTVTATVVASNTVGTRTNTIPAGGVTWSGGSSSVAASATLTVTGSASPTVTKAFTPNAIVRTTGTSQLSITITNPNAAALTGVGLSDTLPRVNNNNKVTVTTPGTTNNVCGAGSSVLTSNSVNGSSRVRLQNGTIPAGGSCTFNVTVRGSNSLSAGTQRVYTNTIPAGALSSAGSATNTTSASATLTVN